MFLGPWKGVVAFIASKGSGNNAEEGTERMEEPEGRRVFEMPSSRLDFIIVIKKATEVTCMGHIQD